MHDRTTVPSVTLTPTPPAVAPTRTPYRPTERVGFVSKLAGVPVEDRQGYFTYPFGGDAGNYALQAGEVETITWEGAPEGAHWYDVFFTPDTGEEPILIGTDTDATDGVQVDWLVPEGASGRFLGIAFFESGHFVFSNWIHQIYSGELPTQGICTVTSRSAIQNVPIFPDPNHNSDAFAALFPGDYTEVVSWVGNGWYEIDPSLAHIYNPLTEDPPEGSGWIHQDQLVSFFGPCDELPITGQLAPSIERLRFDWGTTRIHLSDELGGRSQHIYLIKLIEGERVGFSLAASTTQALEKIDFSITGVSDGTRLDIGTGHGAYGASAEVTQTQDYEIRISNSDAAPQLYWLSVDVPKKIVFEGGEGEITKQGRLYAESGSNYYFNATSGQTLLIRITSPDDTVRFTVVSPSLTPLVRSHIAGPPEFSSVLNESGEYSISLVDYHTTKFPVDFTLVVSLED